MSAKITSYTRKKTLKPEQPIVRHEESSSYGRVAPVVDMEAKKRCKGLYPKKLGDE